MYWNEDEEKRRRIRDIKNKRGHADSEETHEEEQSSSPGKEEAIVVSLADQAELTKRQQELNNRQQEQIDILSKTLQKQNEIMKRIAERLDSPQQVVVQKSIQEPEIVKKDDNMPVLQELDVPQINTDGINVSSGEAGKKSTSDAGISDKVAMLKKLKKKKG